MGDVRSTSVARLHPSSDENLLMKQLVAQFLVHEGHIETAKAFDAEVQTENTALGSTATFHSLGFEEDMDAMNRQRESICLF